MVTFGMVFEQMIGLFVLLLIGYWMNRSKKIPKEAENVLAQLTTKLFLPALVFSVFLEECTLENLIKYSSWVIYGTLFLLICILMAMILARPMARGKTYIEKLYRFALAFPNTGAFATPIVLTLWGTEVFFQYQLFTLPIEIFCFTWGVAQLMPAGQKRSWRERLRDIFNPVFNAILLGMVFGLVGINKYLPEVFHASLQYLSNCYTPIALILTGFVISNYRVKELVINGMSYVYAALRLLIIPGMFVIILRLLHASDMLCILTCLIYSGPCGMNTIIYPASYGEDTRTGSSMVLITSTLSVITIPLLFKFCVK